MACCKQRLLKLANALPQYLNSINLKEVQNLIDNGETINDFENSIRKSFSNTSRSNYVVIDQVLEDYRQHCLNFLSSFFIPMQDKFIHDYVKGINPFLWRNSFNVVPFKTTQYPVSIIFPNNAASNKSYSDNDLFYKLLPNQYKLSNYFGFNNANVVFNLVNTTGQSYTYPYTKHEMVSTHNRMEPGEAIIHLTGGNS